jgi:hypothetical protein
MIGHWNVFIQVLPRYSISEGSRRRMTDGFLITMAYSFGGAPCVLFYM